MWLPTERERHRLTLLVRDEHTFRVKSFAKSVPKISDFIWLHRSAGRRRRSDEMIRYALLFSGPVSNGTLLIWSVLVRSQSANGSVIFDVYDTKLTREQSKIPFVDSTWNSTLGAPFHSIRSRIVISVAGTLETILERLPDVSRWNPTLVRSRIRIRVDVDSGNLA